MSKTRDTGFLGNVIKVDASGNVSFVSGSTTLATINTTGQLSGSSPVLSSSYALNADLLDGLDSTQFTLTSSFAAQTASFTAFTSSILSYTESANNRFSSIETVTGSNITRLSALEVATGSLYSYTSSLNNKTSSFATTGSNTFEGIQTVNSNLVVTGSITAQTLVVQTITSSVDFVTGSTRFGSILDNTHLFTGSVNITGSLTVVTTGTEFQVTSTGVRIGNVSTDAHPITGSVNITGSQTVTGTSTTTGTTNIGNATANPLLVFKTGGSTNYSGNITTDSNLDILNINGGSGANYNSGSGISLLGNDRYGSKTAGTLTLYAGNAVNNTSYGYISMETSGSERMRITYGGNVGIGTSSPATALDVNGSIRLNGTGYIGFGGGTNYIEGDNPNNILKFATNNVERMRITSTGSVLIGTTTAYHTLTVLKNQNANTAAGIYNQTDGTASSVALRLDNGSYNGQLTLFANSYTTSGTAGANILRLYTDGPGGMNFSCTNQHIRFYTAPSEIQRMTILYGGNVGIGNNNPSYRLHVQIDGCGDYVSQFTNTNSGDCGGSGVLLLQGGTFNSGDTTSRYISFRRGDGTEIGSVRRNGSGNVAFETSSDYRLKEDLKDFNGLNKISAIKVYDFKWKNTTERMEGVLAHELQEVIPYAVGGEKDGIDEKGDMIIQGVDYSKLVPILIKAIQEQQAQINELKAQING